MFSIQTITLLDLELAMSKEFRKYLSQKGGKSKKVISDYVSRLNRGLRFLGRDKLEFFKIDSSKKVSKILDDLLINEDFINLSKGNQASIKSAFNNYIKLLRDIEIIKSQSAEHLSFLNESLINLVEQGYENRIILIVKEYNSLLEYKKREIEWPKWLMVYSGVKNKTILGRIQIISKDYKKDKRSLVFSSFKYPNEVAKFLAFKVHTNYLSEFFEK
jgi:intergrase/recombinase